MLLKFSNAFPNKPDFNIKGRSLKSKWKTLLYNKIRKNDYTIFDDFSNFSNKKSILE